MESGSEPEPNPPAPPLGARKAPAPPPGAKRPGPPPGQKPQLQRPRRPPPRPRKHRHGNVGRARGGVVVMFCLLSMVGVLFLMALPIGTPGLSTPAIFGGFLWTTALLIALWRREHWARILLCGLCYLGALAAGIMIPNTLQESALLTAYVVAAVVTAGCGTYLIYSRDMHRLTGRSRE